VAHSQSDADWQAALHALGVARSDPAAAARLVRPIVNSRVIGEVVRLALAGELPEVLDAAVARLVRDNPVWGQAIERVLDDDRDAFRDWLLRRNADPR
jgi:hypothetical protein